MIVTLVLLAAAALLVLAALAVAIGHTRAATSIVYGASLAASLIALAADENPGIAVHGVFRGVHREPCAPPAVHRRPSGSKPRCRARSVA